MSTGRRVPRGPQEPGRAAKRGRGAAFRSERGWRLGNRRALTDPFFDLCSLASQVGERRALLQREIARGFDEAKSRLTLRKDPTEIAARIPGGMLEALAIAGALGRDTSLLDAHYTRSMPAALARQLAAAGVLEEKLFTHRLSLARLPRLHAALDALFSLAASADLSCATTLGATSPERLLEARPTLGALFAGCHFGSSMPMLYAAPGDVSALQGSDLEAWIDARYAGPLAHELAHLQPIDPALVPAPGNLHEALAAWLGSEAFPEQLWPREKSAAVDPGNVRDPIQSARDQDPGGLDALPGGGFFASVGGWLARAIGPREAIRAQAGALDLADALGIQCASALRIYGWLPYLESSAPHLLADTFSPARWWKLFELHRDPALAAHIEDEAGAPAPRGPPPPLVSSSSRAGTIFSTRSIGNSFPRGKIRSAPKTKSSRCAPADLSGSAPFAKAAASAPSAQTRHPGQLPAIEIRARSSATDRCASSFGPARCAQTGPVQMQSALRPPIRSRRISARAISAPPSKKCARRSMGCLDLSADRLVGLSACRLVGLSIVGKNRNWRAV